MPEVGEVSGIRFMVYLNRQGISYVAGDNPTMAKLVPR
jgi:hypothetical protein